jgi:murein DD-endopeptidase MepM/ murein hydrolase activator NlpD
VADASDYPQRDRWTGVPRRADRVAAAADLGVEPPIEAMGEARTPVDHKRVSLRWLAGTVLTGLAGAGLIGSAIYAALNYSSRFAEAPDYVARQRPSGESAISQNNKGDRLARPVDIVAARQTFRAPTTVKVGDREILRNRGFVHIGTTLAMNSVGFSSEVPSFNPLKMLGGDPTPAEVQSEPDVDRQDADVSFQSVNFAPNETGPTRFSLTLDEIQAQVSEHLKNAIGSGPRPNLPLPPQMLLMRTSRAGLAPGSLGYATLNAPTIASPFSSIEVKMVAENVSVIPKYSPREGDLQNDEKLLVIKRNETLQQVLTAQGAKPEHIKSIMTALSGRRGQNAIQEGQKVKILFADIDGSGKMQVARVSIYTDETLEGTVAISDQGEFVLVARTESRPAPRARTPDPDEDDDDNPGTMRLYNSFYETALKQQIPKRMVDELVRIFANDIDFNRSVSGGDAFEVFYSESEDRDGPPELLYAAITARSETFRYYRFAVDRDGTIDYFDAQGRSNRKFLIRKPLGSGEQRSGFGWRRHPILGYSRMHTGVDWAAKIGTPIVASGNGVVIKSKRESGYGNRIEIQHGNGYVTTYNHLSGFARGIAEGVRVRQGQVIGYVGNTGLSTGPHLHYEVIVNGNYVDPLRIRLARTRQLTRQQITDFNRERERIDGLMAKAPNASRVASAEPVR